MWTCFLFLCYLLREYDTVLSVESLYHKDSTASCRIIKALCGGISTWLVYQIENTPCCNDLFFSFPFQDDISDCRTRIPCEMYFVLLMNCLFISIRHCVRIYLQCPHKLYRILLNSPDLFPSKSFNPGLNL